MLLCPVRACGEPLAKYARAWVCANGHSFDLARSGYVNLLQPQDRKSKQPGDSADAVAARRRLLDRGLGAGLTRGIVAALPLERGDALLDAGCGEGHHLAAFRETYAVEGWGVDLSAAAVDLAARRHRDCQWVVANADRRLPFASGSFAAITSITARLNPAEFARLLAPAGRLLIALAAPDDLVELREAVQGEALDRDRTERTLRDFAPHFTLVSQSRIAERAHLDREALLDLLASTYRGFRASERARLETLQSLDVTMSRDVLLLRREN